MKPSSSTARTVSPESIRLRAHLEAAFPSRGGTSLSERLSSGLPALDRLLRGGLPLGQVSAFCGRPGDGLISLLHGTVSRVLEAGHRVALVDAHRSLDPLDWSSLARGRRLWIVRPRGVGEARWAAEELSRSRAFRLVILDLGGTLPRRGPQSQERRALGPRLRGAAREGGAALLVLGDISPGVVGATLALRSERVASEGAHLRLRLLRIRGGAPAQEEMEFDVQERLLSRRLVAHAPFPDRRRAPASRGGRGSTGGVGSG